jgi:two-component system, LytTR family, sensor kinase
MQNRILAFKSFFFNFVYRINEFINKYKQVIKAHIIGWFVYFVIEFCLTISYADVNPSSFLKNFLYVILSFYVLLFGAFIPFSQKRKFKLVIACLFLAFLMVSAKYVFDFYIYKIDFPKDKSLARNYFGFEIWRISQTILYAYAYWIYITAVKEQKRILSLEKKLLKTEIDFLKAQINPHFLFNTLNFVYNKVFNTNKESGEAILSLTRLMRYSVESTKHDQLSLSKEAEMIEEYLQLQRLRFGERLFVEFQKEGLLFLFIMPPLVLMSLVENAFKYGIINEPDYPIKIFLKVDKDQLRFVCSNKKRLDFEEKETTAVGLDNIKRRLEIVYGQNFDLQNTESESIYEVSLNVFWKK